ncbi:MAG TPA: hypothetical protein VD927_01945 [Chryseosolibacter sp.]|nr:hypothetical protein [Chryseosolibacter sp.]
MKVFHKHTAIKLTVFALLAFSASVSHAQGTIADLFYGKRSLADEYFHEGNFAKALPLLESVYEKNRLAEVGIDIAQCYYHLKYYENAVAVFDRIDITDLDSASLFFYAESLLATNRHADAQRVYRQLFNISSDTTLLRKIWQIDNLSYLFEDSLHVAIAPLPVNSTSSELSAVPVGNGIVFASNRRQLKLIQREDARTNAPFYQLYSSAIKKDTAITDGFTYDTPIPFNHQLTEMHTGPIAMYANSQRAVITTTRPGSKEDDSRLILEFIEKRSGRWERGESFSWNSPSYSCMHPSITNDGSRMYFASDKPGGFGGWDIYFSDFKEGAWSTPENCGEQINTRYDELFPFIHQSGMLFFSSNGHAGLGGLDLFKANLAHAAIDVLNLGYPLNSNRDDMGFYVDSLQTHGFLSSNRLNSGLDDDLFEFDIDLQVYPLVIRGKAKMKEHGWKDSTELTVLRNCEIEVIDHIREKVVFKTMSDEDGSFSVNIPYFSKYKVRVIVNGEPQGIISLHIPKHKNIISDHEIVIVKDLFK